MEPDEFAPRLRNNPLAELSRQDLDSYSQHELQERITLLEAEIVRTRARMERAASDRANADALFRKD